MRLINVRTYGLEEFYDNAIPMYAILSHTWEEDEVLIRDMQDLEAANRNADDQALKKKAEATRSKKGFKKIQYACKQAYADYFEYVWIDTCCIDKSSSAELQEAINSMYSWYANASCCYVFLSDILGACPELRDTGTFRRTYLQDHKLDHEEAQNELQFWHQIFSASRWFKRGWTLQELIAPKTLRFYGSKWNYVGDRSYLYGTIGNVTNIPTPILDHTKNLSSYSVAQKMMWAAGRETSRIEDRAYSLLGVFGVNMPMLYGEGAKAFARLQEEVLKLTNDHSIFAWAGTKQTDGGRLLAESPADFALSGKIVRWGRPDSFEMTNRGLRIRLRVIDRKLTERNEHLAILNCRYEDDLGQSLALRLCPYRQSDGYHLPDESGSSLGVRLTFVSVDDIPKAKKELIEITRTIEAESSGTKTLWLDATGPVRVIEASNVHTKSSKSVIYTWTGSYPMVGALIECSTREMIFVAFGRRKYENDPEGNALGVRLLRPRRQQHLSELMAEVYRHDILEDGSKISQQSLGIESRAELEIGTTLIAKAEVTRREIFEEEVIVCNVDVSANTAFGPFELG